MVIEADKNLGLTVIKKAEYNLRVFKELNNAPDSYEPIQLDLATLMENRKSDFQKLCNSTLNRLREDIGGSKITKFIMDPFNGPLKICKLFGLPKLHKPGDRMRLMFPMTGHPCSNLHKFLAKSIEHFVLKFPYLLTNVLELIHNIKPMEFSGEEFLTIADIANFFPTVDLQFAITQSTTRIVEDIAMHIFGLKDPSPKGLVLQRRYWNNLFQVAFKNIEFQFDNQLFLQKKGVPIGSSCAGV